MDAYESREAGRRLAFLELQVARLARDQRDAIAGEVARLRSLVDQ